MKQYKGYIIVYTTIYNSPAFMTMPKNLRTNENNNHIVSIPAEFKLSPEIIQILKSVIQRTTAEKYNELYTSIIEEQQKLVPDELRALQLLSDRGEFEKYKIAPEYISVNITNIIELEEGSEATVDWDVIQYISEKNIKE